ncbi:uncharacterized protein LOC121638843 [Melanotaenia boesemani]|uniref:uncharacterized protein LOC121638843 n=1 Tax=Melanotaenia boesemani TaxID=1250792 RepID=UPI001C05C6C3|nr:uncharacterized protein LOC121638843 [Melanotaenia boesemani]
MAEHNILPQSTRRAPRTRHPPAHLHDLMVNLPPSLSQSRHLSASTPELRSHSTAPAHCSVSDQLSTVLGHQMRLDQGSRDDVDAAEQSTSASSLSSSMIAVEFGMGEQQWKGNVNQPSSHMLPSGSSRYSTLPQSATSSVNKLIPPPVDHTSWSRMAVAPPLLSTAPPVFTVAQSGISTAPMSYMTYNSLPPVGNPASALPTGSPRQAPPLMSSWAQPMPQQATVTIQSLHPASAIPPLYSVPPVSTSAVPPQPVQPTMTGSPLYPPGLMAAAQPGPGPTLYAPYTVDRAPPRVGQYVNQHPSTWPHLSYTSAQNVALTEAPSYLFPPFGTVSGQPPFQPQYVPHVQAPSQPTPVIAPGGPQPVFPSYAPAPVTPAQPVPVPALPKLINDSEREFTDLKMALDHLLNSHAELSEHYKYRVLMEQLVLEEARLITQACRHHAHPYTAAMQALQRQYGQPHQLAQGEIAAILNSPDVKAGDYKAFQTFALRVDLLVGMLASLEGPYGMELMSTGHVDRLLSKLPRYLRDSFVEHLQVRGRMQTQSLNPYNLRDLSEWLKGKAEAQRLSTRMCQRNPTEKSAMVKRDKPVIVTRPKTQPVTIYHGSNTEQTQTAQPASSMPPSLKERKPKAKVCLFCKSNEHYLSQCPVIKTKTADQIQTWIEQGQRCHKCGRTNHEPEACTLKKPCDACQEVHLQVLHPIAKPSSGVYLITPQGGMTSITAKQVTGVYLKVVPVIVSNGQKSLHTYAVLDDGAERTIILTEATHQLGLAGETESMALRTIRQDVVHIKGSSVSFHIASPALPLKSHLITGAFSANRLALAEQSYPIQALQTRYPHLRGLPIQPFSNAQPLLLIGADNTHLIIAKEPVRLGKGGGPVAVCTELGWTLQGPDKTVTHQATTNCYFTSCKPSPDELLHHVARLWQLDVLPFRSEKIVTRSRQDQEAIQLLEERTMRIRDGGIMRYATPLLRVKNAVPLTAPIDAVMPTLRQTERSLLNNPTKADIYEAEIRKLLEAGHVQRLIEEETTKIPESWFIPHHLVEHNGKHRLVFNCSFSYQGLSLNDQLAPGLTLGPSLLGVLLRFRQHEVAVSGDIKAMFHQVRLLPEDQPLLRFIWRNMRRTDPPDVYQWKVLPFGTTSSPCCATFALHKHVKDNSAGHEDIVQTLVESFYVDNCLRSFPDATSAKALVDRMRCLLASGGFEIRQWASNNPSVVSHLPAEAKSQATELWLLEKHVDPQEPALGLSWHCSSDLLGFRIRPLEPAAPTMRHMYRVLATQYDPLGFMLPYTTLAKVLIRKLWSKQRDWDDPNLPPDIVAAWIDWEKELPEMATMFFSRRYTPPEFPIGDATYNLHVFCDASEQAYGAVSYLVVESMKQVHVTFVMARSRVAPKRQLSMPRLELCAALAGAQLASLLQKELTLPLKTINLWTDSTTVLSWLTSDSCRFKVFVGTRVAEIQELAEPSAWRYVDSANNPADDVTRGQTLAQLKGPNRWIQGPPFLSGPSRQWPSQPSSQVSPDTDELKKNSFCGLTQHNASSQLLDITQFVDWSSLVKAMHQALTSKAGSDDQARTCDLRDAELYLLQTCQADSFPEEVQALKVGKPVSPHSRLRMLVPEMDAGTGLMRVGGRLRHISHLSEEDIHPIILDNKQHVTHLLIKAYDAKLLHPGPERVFAELRRQYWILRGRQVIKRHQRTCVDCQRWRGKPSVPRMADLPPARLRLFQPPFFSTGVDCFGPYMVRVGRRHEKRWGLIFKCLTTRCVHLDLINSLDADAFLLALWRFIARRGTPSEILPDQGTNFRGAERELTEALAAMEPQLQEGLSNHQITFKFNPPGAPHFGGLWEREIRSIKTALQVVIGTEALQEEVLLTLLVEVEGILNAKPLGYASADAADPDPVTPNMLLMGRRDASLPQVSYAPSTITKRRWQHSQMMADHFWSQFIRVYLPNLQVRHKWQRSAENLKDGTVVMITDPQSPRASWPVGRITRVITSSDGCVRSAEVKVNGRTYHRPVARLVPLPNIPEEDE